MGYLYDSSLSSHYAVQNVFSGGHWRALVILHLCCRMIIWSLKILGFWVVLISDFIKTVSYGSDIDKWPPRLRDQLLLSTRHFCLAPVKRTTRLLLLPILSHMWWMTYFTFYNTDKFQQDYIQAWEDKLKLEGPVVKVHLFVSDQSLSVPILFDPKDELIGNDRRTFEHLRMWYCLMRSKRGLSEIVLPRRLVRVDKVGLCRGIKDVVRLGSRKGTLDLGRSGPSQVANLEQWWRVDTRQFFQTKGVASTAEVEGLEFVRIWDSLAVSVISIIPFGLSLAFAGAWMGVSIHHFGVDVQVATQTAFTVAAYIVTAGALLIALFAFLDSQTQDNP